MRKFSVKYPYLGYVARNCGSSSKSWTEMVSRGHLHIPSDSFSSQILVMREVFKAVHGEGLREGTMCVQTLTSEMERAGVDLPPDVISFFARISTFFRMRHLNKIIRQNKQKSVECRGMLRKKMKITT